MFDEDDLIHSYSRAQAIADGTLVDVSATAREAGFRYPVALTRAVWCRYVAVPAGVQGQDEQGRLWDVLWMLRNAISRSRGKDVLLFELYVRNDNTGPQLTTLKAICGPDDDGSPCITVLVPDED